MSILKRLYSCSLVLVLAACGGGNPETTDTGPAALTPSTAADSLPAYRASLQSYAANRHATGAPGAASVTRAGNVSYAPAGERTATERGMWTWFDADVATAAKQTRMLNFAAAHGVNLIFLHGETLLDRPALLSAFLDRAAARSIRVELLFGASEWSLTENHAVPLRLLERAGAFIAGLNGARPVGVHFDIEPHALPDWDADPVSLAHQLLALYGRLMAAKPAGLYLNADIAMGYEYLSLTRGGVTKTLSQWLIDATDRTTLMDYRDYSLGEDSIVSHALHPVSYARAQGKKLLLGVETTCNVQPVKVTFCEEGNARMEATLAEVAAYFQADAGYGGIAIHDYAHYRKLAP